MEWRNDGWLYGKKGILPPLTLQAKGNSKASNHKFQGPIKVDFDGPDLDINFQTLRSPLDESWASLRHRKSHLRLQGRKGLDALSAQSLVARRVQSFSIQASTCIHFKPKTQGQMAGLVCYYNTHHWIYLHITINEKKQRVVCIKVCDKGKITSPIDCLLISETGAVELSVRWENSKMQFFIQEQHGEMEEIGPVLDGSILSDDYVRNEKVKYMPAFTGAFVGMACQDLQGRGAYADFDWFTYEEI